MARQTMALLLPPAPLSFDADSAETAPGQTKPRLLFPAFFGPAHQTQTAPQTKPLLPLPLSFDACGMAPHPETKPLPLAL